MRRILVATVLLCGMGGTATAQQQVDTELMTYPDPATPRIDNGVTGDPRPATPEFGKLFFDMQVANAVAQIRSLVSR